MLHFLGYVAIAAVGGAVGYWLRGKGLEERPQPHAIERKPKEKEETREQKTGD